MGQTYGRTMQIVRNRTISIVRPYDYNRTIVRLDSHLIVRSYASYRTNPYVNRIINIKRTYILLELSRPALVRTYSYRTQNCNRTHSHLPYVHTLHVHRTIEDYHTPDVRSSFDRTIIRVQRQGPFSYVCSMIIRPVFLLVFRHDHARAAADADVPLAAVVRMLLYLFIFVR